LWAADDSDDQIAAAAGSCLLPLTIYMPMINATHPASARAKTTVHSQQAAAEAAAAAAAARRSEGDDDDEELTTVGQHIL
jgi:hypothetical protein